MDRLVGCSISWNNSLLVNSTLVSTWKDAKQMNYQKIYDAIVNSDVVRTGYTERHHIVPRCMDGTNDPSNIVTLTAREHFLCHWLLTKIYPKNRLLAHALVCMRGGPRGNGKRYVSKHYGYAREHLSKLVQDHMNSMSPEERKAKYGHDKSGKYIRTEKHRDVYRNMDQSYKKTDEYRQMMSIVKSGEGNGMFGRTHTEEARSRIANSRTSEERASNTKSQWDTMSIEEREARKQAMRKPRPVVKCEACGHECSSAAMKRYHKPKCEGAK